MTFYLLFILLLVFLQISFLKNGIINKYKLHIFIFILFLTIGGFRYEVGADWFSYRDIFIENNISFSIENLLTDPLFYLLQRLCYILENSFSLFIFITFFITFYFKYVVIKKYSINMYMSLIIYFSGIFLIFDINGIRQGLALTFVLYSFRYIFERNFLKYLFFVFISSFLHLSAIIVLPIYFLYNTKMTNKKYILFSFVFIVLGLSISNVIFPFIDQFIINTGYSGRLDYYSNSVNYTTTFNFFDIASIRRIVLWIFILFTTWKDNSIQTMFYKNVYMFSLLIFYSSLNSLEVAYRLSYYYFLVEIFIIPISINSIKNIGLKRIFYMLFLLYYFYMAFKLISNPYGMLDNYNFVLFI